MKRYRFNPVFGGKEEALDGEWVRYEDAEKDKAEAVAVLQTDYDLLEVNAQTFVEELADKDEVIATLQRERDQLTLDHDILTEAHAALVVERNKLQQKLDSEHRVTKDVAQQGHQFWAKLDRAKEALRDARTQLDVALGDTDLPCVDDSPEFCAFRILDKALREIESTEPQEEPADLGEPDEIPPGAVEKLRQLAENVKDIPIDLLPDEEDPSPKQYDTVPDMLDGIDQHEMADEMREESIKRGLSQTGTVDRGSFVDEPDWGCFDRHLIEESPISYTAILWLHDRDVATTQAFQALAAQMDRLMDEVDTIRHIARHQSNYNAAEDQDDGK